jgi:hypothetical protein
MIPPKPATTALPRAMHTAAAGSSVTADVTAEACSPSGSDAEHDVIHAAHATEMIA